MGTVSDIEVKKVFQQLDDEMQATLKSLGKKYYEANKNDPTDIYADDIRKITELDGKVKVLRQFQYNAEKKRICEHCEAIIPSDSVFCNKCGKKLEELDFSSISLLIGSAAQEEDKVSAPINKVCPTCGTKLEADAMFCEKCGQRV